MSDRRVEVGVAWGMFAVLIANGILRALDFRPGPGHGYILFAVIFGSMLAAGILGALFNDRIYEFLRFWIYRLVGWWYT